KLKIPAPAASTSATGTVSVYILRSNDNTDWTDNISPSASTDQAANIKNANLLGIYNLNANNQVLIVVVDLSLQLGPNPIVEAPKYHTLLVVNNCGAALPASGHAATYQPVNLG